MELAGLISVGWAFAGDGEGEVVGPVLTHLCACVSEPRGSPLPVEVSSGGQAGQSIGQTTQRTCARKGRGHLPGQPTS